MFGVGVYDSIWKDPSTRSSKQWCWGRPELTSIKHLPHIRHRAGGNSIYKVGAVTIPFIGEDKDSEK